MYIRLALAFLFFVHDPKAATGTRATLAGGIVVPVLTYVDDSALVCGSTEEASR